MSTQLLLAPVGTGKTEQLLDYLASVVGREPFAKVWVLLPTRRQEEAFRARMIERARRVYFNVEFFNFYNLYARLLDIAGQPQRQLDDTARYRLVRSIVTRLKDERQLRVYHTIAHTPGFVKIAADFIYELKQNLVLPDDFTSAAQSAKDHDLALIYNQYQDALQKHALVDREGEGWLAITEVENKPDIAGDVVLLLVDGYDQFFPLQARLLALLGLRVRNTLITLPTVPNRNDTVGRRFQEAFERLRLAHEPHPLHINRITPYVENRHPALQHLLDNGFRANALTRPANDCLTLIEAPDPTQEVAALLRRVKRLLLETRCQPDDILIAVRDWPRYEAHFAAGARAYNLPLGLHYGEPLAENPLVIALLNLLDLPGMDFRRRALVDVMRSPYFAIPGFNGLYIDRLERISRAKLVVGGRDGWLEAVTRSTLAADENDEHDVLVLEQAEADALSSHLSAFFDAITPPSEASAAVYIAWIEQLIGADGIVDPDDDANESYMPLYTLNVPDQLRHSTNQDIVDRDLKALYQFKMVLSSLLAAHNLLTALNEETRQTWSDFLDNLKRAVGLAKIDRAFNRSGRVLVTSVTDARGLPHRHVFIPGLSESIFPAPTSEDPLYLDSERRELRSAGVFLETQSERSADEGIFYELISLARESLTLSRPYVQNGVYWPESHLWRAVRLLFDDADRLIEQNRIPLGSIVLPHDVASLSEAVIAAADGLNQLEPSPSVRNLYNWLIASHSHWSHVRLGREIELRRMSNTAYDSYSGRLAAPRLIAIVAEELGENHIWSASQFNDYGMCGFRFFAKRLLRLEAVEEPDDGLDAAQLGTLNHAILEETYGRISALGATITPEFADQALTILREVAAELLKSAPERLNFRASALWEQEKVTLLRKLEAVIKLDFSDQSPVVKKFGDEPRRPYRLEAPFGDDARPVSIPIDDVVGSLKVQGYIDRIDRQGVKVILIDYKTGSTTIKTEEMERGRNFQMMLYLLAAQRILSSDPDADAPQAVAGGLFWHLRNQKTSGDITLDDRGLASIIQAQQHLSRHIQRGRAGDFAVQPNKLDHGKCSHYCEFNQLCRVSTINRLKE